MAQRLFFSVPVPRVTQLALLRQQSALAQAGVRGRPVPAANFHLTLAFLGNVTASQKASLLERWAELVPPDLQLSLDTLHYWAKPGVLALGARRTPIALGQLASALQQDAAHHGLHASRQAFRPHITLFRGASALLPELPEQLEPPIILPCHSVELMLSENGPGGVEYHRLKHWA
ncbi:RNA 2',3'-cyclic phosphodiesterase [Ferrimonas marina]|uniref:2'-5' RNA ligase n=1 Tax=Ferrimonas marina TaxID=299255 RepID=A0A1M5ZF38_9GAMM|nr:RNA 2',3'-cyclic phosphodiesterase [Ferrimonas marina]SHI22779.1 2'-5' RNA ligase [Ferrimonas marina]